MITIRMQFNAVFCIIFVIILRNADCRLRARQFLVRRQNQGMFQHPNQMFQAPYLPQPVSPEVPMVQTAGVNSAQANFPPNAAGFPFSNAGLRSGYAALPYENPRFPPVTAASPVENAGNPPSDVGFASSSLSGSSSNTSDMQNEKFPNPPLPPGFQSTSAHVSSTSLPKMYSPTNIYPGNVNLRRRRKNAPEKDNELEELLENGMALFENSPMKKVTKRNNYFKIVDDYLKKNLTNNNATVIPIPRGFQIKKVSKQGKEKINSKVNITSSTQRTLSADNSTEIENMVEMEMEKNIEDEKGAKRGSEEVRIIETEHVKPVVNQKGRDLFHQKRKRKSYRKRFAVHHRGKRSEIDLTEPPRSNLVFNKMARRFLREAKRKQLIANRTEIDEFMKFFLKQMRKFRNSHENRNSKNTTLTLKDRYSDGHQKPKLSKYKVNREKKNFDYLEKLNIALNLNMTWNVKMKNPIKYRSTAENYNHSIMDLKAAASTPDQPTSQPKIPTLVYVTEKHDSGFSVVLFFVVITFLFMLSMWIVRGKKHQIRRPIDMISKSRTYRFHHEEKYDEIDGLSAGAPNVYIEDYPQLEWQSENGDWLSGKETDFK